MNAVKPQNSQLRLRVFAGPNGSGKSTVVKSIRESEVSGNLIDIGTYINADDIARSLSQNNFTFKIFEISPNLSELTDFALESGLINENFSLDDLTAAIIFKDHAVRLVNRKMLDRVAQLLARFIRGVLLRQSRRFSFETVFSHESNLQIMEQAAAAGYKVYLYFVATESPAINKYRVSLRKKQGGHDVPVDKIESRYYASLALLYRASQIAYQAFFFDNSTETPFRLIAHFKKVDGVKVWDKRVAEDKRIWFEKYYVNNAKENGDENTPNL